MNDDTFPIQLLTSIVSVASRQLRELTVYLELQDEKVPEEPALTEDEMAACIQLDAALCKPQLRGMKMTVCSYGKGASIEAVDRWQRMLVGRLPKFCSGEGKLSMKRTPSMFPLQR